jgi:hypothetical protein
MACPAVHVSVPLDPAVLVLKIGETHRWGLPVGIGVWNGLVSLWSRGRRRGAECSTGVPCLFEGHALGIAETSMYGGLEEIPAQI